VIRFRASTPYVARAGNNYSGRPVRLEWYKTHPDKGPWRVFAFKPAEHNIIPADEECADEACVGGAPILAQCDTREEAESVAVLLREIGTLLERAANDSAPA
jgi:hypothetical protein